jgi:hypothetical protein
VKLKSVLVLILLVGSLFVSAVHAQDNNTIDFKLGDPMPFGERHTLTVGSVTLGETQILTCVLVGGKSAAAPSVTKCFSSATVSVSGMTTLPNSHVSIAVLVAPSQAKPVLCIFQTGEDDKAPISYDCQPAG